MLLFFVGVARDSHGFFVFMHMNHAYCIYIHVPAAPANIYVCMFGPMHRISAPRTRTSSHLQHAAEPPMTSSTASSVRPKSAPDSEEGGQDSSGPGNGSKLRRIEEASASVDNTSASVDNANASVDNTSASAANAVTDVTGTYAGDTGSRAGSIVTAVSRNSDVMREALMLSRQRVERLESMLLAAGVRAPAAGDAASPPASGALSKDSTPLSSRYSPPLREGRSAVVLGGKVSEDRASSVPLESIERRHSKGGWARVTRGADDGLTGGRGGGLVFPPPPPSPPQLPSLPTSHSSRALAPLYLPSVADLYPALTPAPASSTYEPTTKHARGGEEGGASETGGEGDPYGNLGREEGEGDEEVRLQVPLLLGRDIDSSPPSPVTCAGREDHGAGADDSENLQWQHSLWLRNTSGGEDENDADSRISV